MLLETLSVYALTATYTGKAAHVLRQKGVDAQTIHSLIYRPRPGSDPVRFELNEDSAAADADLLVLDEVSMIDDQLAADLRSFGRKMLVLGDPGQLPPIRGAGAFTSREPDAFLTEVHRQAEGSPILQLATLARKGEVIPLASEGDARVIAYDRAEILVPGRQILCGVHRHRWALTRLLRENKGAHGEFPCAGEPVICCRNERERGLFNGMLGVMLEDAKPAPNDTTLLCVRMDDGVEREIVSETRAFREHYLNERLLDRRRRGIQDFDFAYVLTTHKAQGSEWSDVVVVDDSAYFREDRHRWFYTSITRAADRLTVLRR
jgi:exodeoxyribonuclease-5